MSKLFRLLYVLSILLPTTVFAQQKGSDYKTVERSNIAVIIIDFPDTKDSIRSLYPTLEQIRKELFDSSGFIQRYLSDMSFGKYKLTGDVFGPFTHQDSITEENNYQHFSVLTLNPIGIPGFQASDYTELFFIEFNDYAAGGCASGTTSNTMIINGKEVVLSNFVSMGLAIGPPNRDESSGAFLNHFTDVMMSQIFVPIEETSNDEYLFPGEYFFPDYSGITVFQRLILHELMHTLGVWPHANSKTNGNRFSFETEVEDNYSFMDYEYGNKMALMGDGHWATSICGGNRDILGWTDDENRIKIDSFGTQRVRIYPINRETGNRICEIRIPYKYSNYTIDNEAENSTNARKNAGYFLEVREVNKWDSTLSHPAIIENTKGILIMEHDGSSTKLIDASPSPNLKYEWGSVPDLRDVALKPTMCYRDSTIYFSNVEEHPDGSFSVDINVVDPSSSKTPKPVSNFSSNITTESPSISIHFSDESTNSPDSWVWNFGDNSISTKQNPEHTYTTPGVYTVQLKASNYAGDDVVIKTDYITIQCQDYTIVDTTIICAGDNYKGWTETGMYQEKLLSVNGCDSLLTTHLLVSTIEKPTITQTNDTLSCDISGIYNWYFNDELLGSATAQKQVVNSSGIYYVIVSNENGCLSAISNRINVSLTAVNEFNSLENILVYPNPTTGRIKMEGTSLSAKTFIQLFDGTGKKLYGQYLVSPNSEIDITDYSPGLYNLVVIQGKKKIDFKIIKK